MISTVKIKNCKATKFCCMPKYVGFAVFAIVLALFGQGNEASAYPDGMYGDSQSMQHSTGSRYDLELVQDPSIRLGDGGKRLSDINILLPLQNCSDCRRAFKVVTAINGCYSW